MTGQSSTSFGSVFKIVLMVIGALLLIGIVIAVVGGVSGAMLASSDVNPAIVIFIAWGVVVVAIVGYIFWKR